MLCFSHFSTNIFFVRKYLLFFINLCIHFSRSKKDKTSEKRDATEEKKQTENDLLAANNALSVRNFFSFDYL
jgi:hypothetical protein